MKLAYPFLTQETEASLMAYRGEQAEVFQEMKVLGYDAIELYVRDPAKINIQQLKSDLKSNDLEPAAVNTDPIVADDLLTFTSENEPVRKEAIERIKAVIDLAAQLHCPVVFGKIRGNLQNEESEASFEWMLQGFKETGEYAQERGVEIAIEPQNEKYMNYLNKNGETLAFIDRLNIPSFKVMLDTHHMYLNGEDIPNSIHAAEEKLVFLHLADETRELPTQETETFSNMVKALEAINYTGYLSMEIQQEPTSKEAAKAAIELIRASASQ
jgi:sugar phosphate isomerase/epimerase